MATKLHINPETDKVSACHALIKCKFQTGETEIPHFDTHEEAYRHLEEKYAGEFTTNNTLKKPTFDAMGKELLAGAGVGAVVGGAAAGSVGLVAAGTTAAVVGAATGSSIGLVLAVPFGAALIAFRIRDNMKFKKLLDKRAASVAKLKAAYQAKQSTAIQDREDEWRMNNPTLMERGYNPTTAKNSAKEVLERGRAALSYELSEYEGSEDSEIRPTPAARREAIDSLVGGLSDPENNHTKEELQDMVSMLSAVESQGNLPDEARAKAEDAVELLVNSGRIGTDFDDQSYFLGRYQRA